MAVIAWSSVKIKRPLFPGTLNYSVLARDRGREREGERGIWMWLLTLRKLSFFSKGAGSLFSEVESMAEKENKHRLLCFHVREFKGAHLITVAAATWCQLTNDGIGLGLVPWEGKCIQADEINYFSFKKWMQLNNMAESKHTSVEILYIFIL